MQQNTNGIDRAIRVVIALVAAVLAVNSGLSSALGMVLALVAVIMLGTAAVGFCPLYRLLGISTRGDGK